jgi:hypothetical protein
MAVTPGCAISHTAGFYRPTWRLEPSPRAASATCCKMDAWIDVVHRRHGREHGLVLSVAAMHPMATDQVERLSKLRRTCFQNVASYSFLCCCIQLSGCSGGDRYA